MISFSQLHARSTASLAQVPLWLFGAWLVLSTSQSLHFYFYFEQSLWDSIRWSVRDWLVWYLIFATVFALC
ncbi:MAG: hypothetical protein AAGC71_14910, partial [Pseudomonadota bacterium]